MHGPSGRELREVDQERRSLRRARYRACESLVCTIGQVRKSDSQHAGGRFACERELDMSVNTSLLAWVRSLIFNVCVQVPHRGG